MAPRILALARAVRDAGGRALLVGGWVRDQLRGAGSGDYDIEVFGLTPDALERVLRRFGRVAQVGRAFGVFKVQGLSADISLPRRDSKVGRGHRGFDVAVDPGLSFEEAARRRDLTINSIGYNPLTGEILDPFGGRADLARGVLRATDPARFGEDPLRALRVAQHAARFEMRVDPGLRALVAGLDLSELPGERLYGEFQRLLLDGVRPSLGLGYLADAGLLRFFPELDAMRGVPQDPRHHPEGDVWIHTTMVCDAAAGLRRGEGRDDLALMMAALLHDTGKAVTTVAGEDGRVRARGHDVAGVGLAETFLARLRAPGWLVRRTATLTRHHLAPVALVKQASGDAAFRRLARALADGDVTPALLARLTRADQLGRTTAPARQGRAPEVDAFTARARALGILDGPAPPAVKGRHLADRGVAPGPEMGEILRRCLALQDRTGLTDPDAILDRVLG